MRRISWLTVLLAVLLAAFALRVFRLEVQSLWYDEAFSAYLAHFDLAEIAARTATDIQPPLYYFLLHFWIALAGNSEFALRFLSLCFGVLTIPLVYAAALRFFHRDGARIAALLATVSPLYIWYSQEARMYTLITFLLLLSSYSLLRALENQPRERGGNEGTEGKQSKKLWEIQENRWWVAFVIASIAAVYTHYFAFVVIVFQLLFTIYYLLYTSLRSRFTFYALRFTLCFALIFAAFLPWMPFVVARLGQDASYWQGALKLDEAIRHIFINFTTGESVLESQAQWIAAGWLGCLLVSWLVGWLVSWLAQRKPDQPTSQRSNDPTSQRSNHPIIFLTLYLVIPLALLLLLFSRNPKFNARYLMIASPAFFLLLAAGLAYASRITNYVLRFTFCLLPFAFLLFTSVYADANAYFDPAFTKASFRDVARYIETHSAPGEAVILTSGHMFPAFDYYYRGDLPTIRLPDDPTLNTEHVLGYDAAHVLNQSLADKRGAWLVLWQDEVVDPNGFAPMLLSSRGTEEKIEGTNFYQVRLRHWTLQPGAHFSTEPAPGIRREANFKNAVKLLGADAPEPTPADIGASFNLYWQSLDALDEDYLVALRVVDAAGNLWGKQDRRPAGYNYPTTRWKKGENLFGAYTVPLIAGAPAGDYFVEVTLYTKNNASGLDVLAPNGAPIGKSVRLGPLPVLPATKPAAIAALDIPHTISQPLPPFTLLGYQLGRDKASAGETIPLTLFWRADRRPDKDYRFRVWFDSSPTTFFPLANAQFPTSVWRAGEIVRGQYLIQIPPEVTAGTKELKLNLDWGADVGLGLALAPIAIEKTDRAFIKPPMQFSQSVTFGNNALALVGYDLPATTVKLGDTLKLVLYWQARGAMDKPYTVFVHLLDKNNQVVAQKDAAPVNGARPTTGWIANEYITDPYELPIQPNVAPGNYQIEVGWYDAADFSRLQVLDDNGAAVGDHVILKMPILVH